jgi:hypothetical protein
MKSIDHQFHSFVRITEKYKCYLTKEFKFFENILYWKLLGFKTSNSFPFHPQLFVRERGGDFQNNLKNVNHTKSSTCLSPESNENAKCSSYENMKNKIYLGKLK